MRQLPADKYNVAWFKLAEFVARGEKERALGLYRLLIHSFDDVALAYQLEGDLLLSFNDQEAVEKYIQAVSLYEKQGRMMEALAIYEHIIAIKPLEKYFLKTISLYEIGANIDRAIEILELLCTLYLDEKNYEALEDLIKKKEHSYRAHHLVHLYKYLSLSLASRKDGDKNLMIMYAKKAIDILLETDDESMQVYVATLKAINEDCYRDVCSFIKNKKKS